MLGFVHTFFIPIVHNVNKIHAIVVVDDDDDDDANDSNNNVMNGTTITRLLWHKVNGIVFRTEFFMNDDNFTTISRHFAWKFTLRKKQTH